MDYLDLHIARTKMQLKNSNHCVSFVSTLWKGEVILCAVNNIQPGIMNIFCNRTLGSEEFDLLEGVVIEFIFGDSNGKNKFKLSTKD